MACSTRRKTLLCASKCVTRRPLVRRLLSVRGSTASVLAPPATIVARDTSTKRETPPSSRRDPTVLFRSPRRWWSSPVPLWWRWGRRWPRRGERRSTSRPAGGGAGWSPRSSMFWTWQVIYWVTMCVPTPAVSQGSRLSPTPTSHRSRVTPVYGTRNQTLWIWQVMSNLCLLHNEAIKLRYMNGNFHSVPSSSLEWS